MDEKVHSSVALETDINAIKESISRIESMIGSIVTVIEHASETLDLIHEALTPSDQDRLLPKHMAENRKALLVGVKVYAVAESNYAMKGEWGVVVNVTDAFVKVIFANGGLLTIKVDETVDWIENSGILVPELSDYTFVNFAQTMNDWRNGKFDVAVRHARIS